MRMCAVLLGVVCSQTLPYPRLAREGSGCCYSNHCPAQVLPPEGCASSDGIDRNPPTLGLGWTLREVVQMHVAWFESEVCDLAVVDGVEQDYSYMDPLQGYLDWTPRGKGNHLALAEVVLSVVKTVWNSQLKEHHRRNVRRHFMELYSFLQSPDRRTIHLSEINRVVGMRPASLPADWP